MQKPSGADLSAAAPAAGVSPVDEIIYRHVMWVTLGSGFPIPLLDVAIVLGFQLRMVRELCEHFGVPFSEHRVLTVAVALLSGSATEGVARGPFISFITRSIPPVNFLAAFLKAYIPFKLGIVVAGGATYAVGRLFAQHLAEGGNLEEVDSVTFQRYFRDQLKMGIKKVREGVL